MKGWFGRGTPGAVFHFSLLGTIVLILLTLRTSAPCRPVPAGKGELNFFHECIFLEKNLKSLCSLSEGNPCAEEKSKVVLMLMVSHKVQRVVEDSPDLSYILALV